LHSIVIGINLIWSSSVFIILFYERNAINRKNYNKFNYRIIMKKI